MFSRVVRRTQSSLQSADPGARRKSRIAHAGIAAVAAGALLAPSHAAQADTGGIPAQVEATYQISFNGFNIGSFKFRSQVDGKRYTLDGDAELSALLGAFKWRGVSRASGTVGKTGPRPAGYTLSFKGNSQSGAIRVGFGDNRVTSATVVPPFPVTADEVPLRSQHLNGALDPLTAVMALTFGSASNPCGQTLQIFDGKQRFDLALGYRGQRAASRGQALVVCGVDYRPLGGYRANAQTEQLAKANGIEVAMLPLPRANMAVPHEVTIPTSVGSVVLSAEKIAVTDKNHRRIAFLQD